MHGMPLVIFTVGMMAIVFLMCLDHYILGTPQSFLLLLFDQGLIPGCGMV